MKILVINFGGVMVGGRTQEYERNGIIVGKARQENGVNGG